MPNVTYYYRVRARNLDNIYTDFTSARSTHTLCNVPVNLQFTAVNISSVTISWSSNNNSNSTIYELYISTGVNTNYSLLATGYLLTYTHIGLSPNVTYYYKIRAKNINNIYTAYVEESTHTLCVPAQNVVFINVYLSSMTVSWSSGSITTGYNPEYTTYRLENKTNDGFWQTKYIGKLASVVVGGLGYNTTYHYRVTAVNLDNINTEYSLENSTCTLANVPFSRPFSSVSNTSITSRWLDNGNPDGTIYICEVSSTTGFVVVLSSQTTVLQAVFSNLQPNTTYYSRVKAKNFNSIDTAYVSLGSTITQCSLPDILPIEEVYLSSITVVWSSGTPANPEYTTYELHWSSISSFSVYSSTIIQSLSYIISALNVNTTYYFRARAVNLVGTKTEFVSLPSTSTLCNVPTQLQFTAINISSISIQWSENTNPSGTRYEIWCSTGTEAHFGKVRTVTGNSFVHLGLLPNVTYYYKVCAVNHSDRPTEFTSVISTWTLCNPPTSAYFTNIEATSITVNWSNNANSLGTLYFVEISSVSEPFNPISNSDWINILSYTFTPLLPNTTYYFRGKAKNYGGVETHWVSFGSTRTLCNTPGPVGIVNVTTYSITFVIDENNNSPSTLYSIKCILYTGATMYVQENGTLGSGMVYRTKSEWEVSGSTIVDINILPNRKYILSSNARAADSSSATPYSTLTSVYTLANVPAGLNALEVSSMTVKISWISNNNPIGTEYQCELSSTSETGPYHKVSDWLTTIIHTFSNLLSNTTYYIRVKARNNNLVETDYTSVISTATGALPVKSISVVSISTYSITWQWEPYGNEANFFAEVYTTTTTPYTKIKDTLWINSTWWCVEGLLPNTSYQIFVKTKNMFNVDTETKTLISATQIEPPSSVTIWYVGVSSMSFQVNGPFTNFGQGLTKIYVSTTSDSGPYAGSSGSSDKDADYALFNQWVNTFSFTDINLVENATYKYKIKLRNIYGTETDWVLEFTTYTTFANPTLQHFWVDYTVSGSTYVVIKSSVPQHNPYFGLTGIMVENITTSKIYITTNAYEIIDESLQENTGYSYRIKYRNVSGIWTEWSSEITKYTLCRQPYNFNVSPIEILGKRLFMTVGRFSNDNVGNSAYRFVCVSGVGNNSPWTNSDYGGYEFQTASLLVNSSYTYQVVYRNNNGIETYGPQITKFTYANIPGKPIVSSPTTDSVTVKINNNDGNPPHTEYAIYNENEGKWLTSIGTFSLTAVWLTYNSWGGSNGIINTGLSPNTTYYYKVIARNGDGVETNFSPSSDGVSTLATTPLYIKKSTSTTDSITWQWESGGGEKDFYAWMVNPSTSTGWTTKNQWIVSGLLTNTSYQVSLKARNNVNVETVEISTLAFTSIEQPESVIFISKTTDYIVVKVSGSFSNLTSGLSAIRIINLTRGATSVWYNDVNQDITFGNLNPNTKYKFVSQARNANAEETLLSKEAEVYTLANPPSEFNLTVVNTDTVHLQWQPATEGGNTGFKVDCSSDNVVWINLVEKTTYTYYIDVGLSLGVTYYYRIYGYNGDYVLTEPIQKSIFVFDIVPPAKVTTLVALTGKKIGEIELQWLSTGDDGYLGDVKDGKFEIYISTYEDFSSYQKVVISTSYSQGNKQSMVVSSLVPKTTYYFRISLSDEKGNFSEFSNITSNVSKSAPSVVYHKPHNGEVGVLTDTKIEIIFDTEMETATVATYIKIVSVRDNFGIEISSFVEFVITTEDKIKFILTPVLLNKNHLYKIVISTEVVDVYTNPLQQEVVFKFSTIMDYTKYNKYISDDKQTVIEIPVSILPEDSYIITSTEPLTSSVIIDKNNIKIANEKVDNQYAGEKIVLKDTIREFVLYNKNKEVLSGQFNGRLKITIPYKDNNQDGFVDGTKIKEKTLKMYYLDEDNMLWIRIPTSIVDKDKNIVYAYVSHFSVYTIIGEEDFSLDDTYAYPVPFRPNFDITHKVITFVNLSRESVIKIYTVNGELIKTIYEPQDDGVEDYKTTWDAKEAGSDVYIYVVENKKNRKTGKIIIVK
ncbi:MAG: fibronectin type III domain-containing protein [Endomicrobia bacterium]|nr:fibronectin type III domain-containing protein [Endomicrobiia bacterium]